MEVKDNILDLSWYIKRSETDLAKAKVDELFWKIEKFHYFAKKVQELNELMKKKEEYLKKWKGFGIAKWGINFAYEVETGVDQEVLFNFESFLNAAVETIDVLPYFALIIDVKKKSFRKFRKDIDKNQPEAKLTKYVNANWKNWIEDLKEYRDSSVHHCLYYQRARIRISGNGGNSYFEMKLPAVTIPPIRAHRVDDIEEHEYEFKCKVEDEGDPWDPKDPDEAYWEAYENMFIDIEDYIKFIRRNLDNFIEKFLEHCSVL